MKLMKSDKGVAGLNLFLSLIVSLFVIGLIVMIFSLVGGGLTTATYTPTSASPTGEVLTNVNTLAATSFAAASATGASCSSPVFYNQTGGETILSGNYTVSGCSVIAKGYVNSSGVNYETLTNVTNLTTTNFAYAGTGVNCTSITLYNKTDGALILETGNYTTSDTCNVTAVTGSPFMATYEDNAYDWYVNYTYSVVSSPYNATNWLVNYTYTYNADNTATRTIGNTTEAIAGAVDWFDIFIVIAAMVVLILLTVIIIAAIRGSGLISESTA